MNIRHNMYKKLMINISHHLVEGYLIHRELTDREDSAQCKAQEGEDKRIRYAPLQYANAESASPLKSDASIYTQMQPASKRSWRTYLFVKQVIRSEGLPG